MSNFLKTRQVADDIDLGTFLKPTPVPKPFLKAFSDEKDSRTETYGEGKIPRSQFSPLVVMFIGRRGQGKTLAMTWMANFLLHDWQKNNVPRKVAANYAVDFAHYQTPYLVDELMQFPTWGTDLEILVDECQSAFPGRRSLAASNVMFSNFITQIRKLRNEIYFTTQFPQVMDWQMLIQCDLFCLCEKRDGGRQIHLNIWDWWGQWTGMMNKKPWPPRYGTHDWEQDLYQCDKIWRHYNTEQFQPAMWAKNRDAMLARQWNMEGLREPENEAEIVQGLTEQTLKAPETISEYMSLKFRAGQKMFALADTFDEVKRLYKVKNMNDYMRQVEKEGGYLYTVGNQTMALEAKPVEKKLPELMKPK